MTNSRNVPVTEGAFQQRYGGGETNSVNPLGDAFVVKLNPAGSALVYSTYLGGARDDVGGNIYVDSSGNAHVVGSTQSTNFPVTAGAFQTRYGGEGGQPNLPAHGNVPAFVAGDA